VTLFDCGPGTLRALAAAGIGLGEVRRIVISHFHPDHCLDLAAVAFARRNPCFAPGPLELVGPRGLVEWLEGLASALGRWACFEGVAVREAAPGDVLAAGADPTRLSCAATGHTPEALAWRADLGEGGSVVYSGDSGECDALAELAAGADLFVCECSFPEDQAVEAHLTPRGAGRLARRAGCRRLLLTHFYPTLEPAVAVREAGAVFDGAVCAARDGSRHFLCAMPWS
jgi:ribonuclease BN (tRNA processing enzyme)